MPKYKFLCTLNHSRQVFSGKSGEETPAGFSLKALCAFFHEEEGTHRALSDTKALQQVPHPLRGGSMEGGTSFASKGGCHLTSHVARVLFSRVQVYSKLNAMLSDAELKDLYETQTFMLQVTETRLPRSCTGQGARATAAVLVRLTG
jgi:hypothetical protein